MATLALAELSDSDLIARVRAGQREDFEILVRRYNQRLFRAARGILRSDTEAEDVVQQTWLEVFRNLDQFRGDAAFTSWATRICIHAAFAHARKRPPIADVDDLADTPDAVTPAHAYERAETATMLESCLARLPQGSREVVVLRDVLELDTAETAACLGISEEAVRVRLHRARAAIAADLMVRLDGVYSFDGARCDRLTRNVMSAIALMGA
jgi:RNA polymerase sigma-70 factor (ECF subfamily)